ncbi:serine/threonine-protein kinase Sgk2 [Ilyonectria sp. MPI-CAGE-AT-0026]|nr:serine/threonine-protein kinase Sgk2 [Ilyonectria sp. MPI-CAGE-AT-0026]
MADQAQSRVIEDNPIRNGLDAFRYLFNSTCEGRGILRARDALDQLDQEDVQDLTSSLLPALQILPATRLLPSKTGRGTLRSDLLTLISAVASADFDFDRVKPLLKSALTDEPDDALIWDQVYNAVTGSTPPPRPIHSSIQQTPWSQNTSGFDVDPVLTLELECLYVGLPNFHKTFFGDVPDLDKVSEAVFGRCTEGDNPLFKEGWSGWPAGAKESDVLTWFGGLIPKLEAFAGDRISTPAGRRKLMDIGFVNSDITYDPDSKDSRYRWSHILVAGELKGNPKADKASIAWIDLATYAREVLAAKDTRRFVLGFTLCGSLMRVWDFDRLGGIASKQFDINKKDGALQFVTTILGFLWMNEDGLGFDPTIITSDGERYIEIERDGQTQRLIIDEVMKRAHCIAGRATTCWKAHRKEDPQTPLVIKDSWQYTDRDEEGILVQKATEKGVVNVARYYHHETVRVRGADDDVRSNVRKGLDITKATNYRPGRPMLPSNASVSSVSRKGETAAALPPSKRSCSASPAKASVEALPNRVHRRVILRDYGKPIYKASSCVALLAALEGCIEGHERAFLIDLDVAIKAQREGASGAKGKTGTRAFMAIGALLGEQHSFMHDLESFFWVLFWICIHCNGPEENKVVPEFDKWNYVNMGELAKLKKKKKGKTAEDNFTSYYQPLTPWVNRLRKAVFPNGGRWEREDKGFYARMKEILQEARRDPKVLAER